MNTRKQDIRLPSPWCCSMSPAAAFPAGGSYLPRSLGDDLANLLSFISRLTCSHLSGDSSLGCLFHAPYYIRNTSECGEENESSEEECPDTIIAILRSFSGIVDAEGVREDCEELGLCEQAICEIWCHHGRTESQ